MRKLIKSAVKGDAKAFIELMDLYNYDLYKTGKAILKTDEDVADAMQDTILACWQNIKYLKKPRYFKTWLTKIMINCCFKILEKRKKYVLNDEIQNDIILNSGYSQSEFNSIEINDILNNMDNNFTLDNDSFSIKNIELTPLTMQINYEAAKDKNFAMPSPAGFKLKNGNIIHASYIPNQYFAPSTESDEYSQTFNFKKILNLDDIEGIYFAKYDAEGNYDPNGFYINDPDQSPTGQLPEINETTCDYYEFN